MSLDYSITKVKDWETDQTVEKYTRVMVFATTQVDLGEIRADNINEWLFRVEVFRLMKQGFGKQAMIKDGEVIGYLDYYPTREHLEKFIGMYTNVITTSRKEFMKKISAWLVSEATAIVRDGQRGGVE